MHFGSPHRCGSDHFEEEKCGNHLQQQAQITSLWTPPYTFRVWGESKGGTQGKLMQGYALRQPIERTDVALAFEEKI
jgi:hypothetical protein